MAGDVTASNEPVVLGLSSLEAVADASTGPKIRLAKKGITYTVITAPRYKLKIPMVVLFS